MEEAYLKNAYTGFTEALQTEGFPMCGMDEITVEIPDRSIGHQISEIRCGKPYGGFNPHISIGQ